MCENNHEFDSRIAGVSNGNWCPNCNIWKNQKECIEIIEKLTTKKFKQSRPKFLNRLELDGYNEDLKLALEYNGKQHYEYNSFFHNNDKENFIKQKERDRLKQELCVQNNVYLITVPYWIIDKQEFITNEYSKYVLIHSL
jgi:hypothetical protein